MRCGCLYLVMYISSQVHRATFRGSSALWCTQAMSLKRLAVKPGCSVLQLSSVWHVHYPFQLQPLPEGRVHVYSVFMPVGNWCHPRIKSGYSQSACLNPCVWISQFRHGLNSVHNQREEREDLEGLQKPPQVW